MRRRPPRSTLTGTLLTSTTLFRSASRLGRKSLYSDPVSACVFLARAKSAVLARGLKASTRDRILDAITFDHTCVSDRSGANGEGDREEHTSELQSLMRISYAVFCWKKIKQYSATMLSYM